MFTSYVYNSVSIVKVAASTKYERAMFEGVARAMVDAIARELHLNEHSVVTNTHRHEKTIGGNCREVLSIKRVGDIDGIEERNLQIEVAIPTTTTLLHALDKAHNAARRSLSNRLAASVVFPKADKQYEGHVYTLEVMRGTIL